MTLDVFIIEMPDGTWVAKCETHKAWKYVADSYDEAMAGCQTSLKRHHSRQLQFRFFVVGTVST
jgi:predicted RNase H-like HicB family nuclease